MKINKKNNTVPFDMKKKPVAQKWYLMPLIWGISYLQTRKFSLKIKRTAMNNIKPPFLVIAAHQGEADYTIAPLALFPHRANYVSDMEGFATFGEWIYRSIGCIGKRRYVTDYSVISNIKYALNSGQPVVVYPESRHSNVGTTAVIPKNMGRLAKLMGVPLVTLSVHGSYLANPFWDEKHTRKVPIEAEIECVYTADEIKNTDADTIQRTIEKKLQYNEYQWQYDNKVAIDYAFRAEGLHKALYQCINCGSEFSVRSQRDSLLCTKCRKVWKMSPYGELESDGQRLQIPQWYEWQRENICRTLKYGINEEYNVRVMALYNSDGFIPLGDGKLITDSIGFTLILSDRKLFFKHSNRESVQTEYDYKGTGMCIVLSDKNCCYYIYSDDYSFNPTRIQFIGEELYQKSRKGSVKSL